MYPVRITGYSEQDLYWDKEKGRPYAYHENFDLIFTMSTGDEIEYKGSAEGEVIHAEPMDREKITKDIEKELKKEGVDDVSVKPDTLGVTLTLENIQFPPDSSFLWDSEKIKLKKIAKVLNKYPKNDILITGHTALAGTEAGRQNLSEERAQAVGKYLLEIGVRNSERIITRGMGAQKPIASNKTEIGKQKNRRVEITILEN